MNTPIKHELDRRTEWKLEDGTFHREDGPAVIYQDGFCIWYKNGKFHREDGPAVTYASGEEHWFRNDRHHRTDGPAIIYPNGEVEYYLDGIECDPLTFLIKSYTMFKEIIFKYNNNWDEISKHEYLTEDFIEKYKESLDWDLISEYQILSETFIEKHISDLNLYYVFVFQRLSEDFINNYIADYNEIPCDWDELIDSQVLSEEFYIKHINNIDQYIIDDILLERGLISKESYNRYIMSKCIDSA